MTRIASTSRAFAWVAAGAIGATVVTGVAFAGGGSHGGGQSPDRHNPSSGSSVAHQGQNGSATSAQNRAPAASDPTKSKPRSNAAGGRFGHGPRFGRLGRTLHGEFVVAGKDGKFVTVKVQTGVVTDVSDTSITVKSSDNFIGTYVINGDTRIRVRHHPAQPNSGAEKRTPATASDLAVNDIVWIVATVDGSDSNARLIVARSPKAATGGSAGNPTARPPAVFESSLLGI